ncbi:MAG: hydrogenase maturation protease [Chloroflexi bacterium]|nr:hydrogenase maturation protease [Chloroflexota bacterium]
MSRVLVIGYGNVLRTDDGIGPAVAACVAQRCAAADVEVLSLHQLLPELAEPISQARQVVFIDASIDGVPGTIACWRLLPGPETEAAGPLVHHLDPQRLLELAQLLYGHAPAAALVSVVGQDFSLGEGLSECVRHALPDTVAHVDTMIAASSP